MRRVAVAAACIAVLVACSDGGGEGSSQPGSSVPTIRAAPSPPHFVGREEVLLQPALAYVGKQDACPPEPGPPERLCDPDGQAYRPLGRTREAMVTEVTTELNSGHTAWMVTVVFARRSRAALEDTGVDAAGIGGHVLVLDQRGRIVVAVGPADLDSGRIELGALDKPTAWSLVTAFAST